MAGDRPWLGVALAATALLVACLEGETGMPPGARCAADGDCGSDARCLYGRCRAGCEFDRDCPAGERCVDLGRELGRACTVTDSDAPAPRGEPCLDDDECEAGTVCAGEMEWTIGICSLPCGNDGECEAAGTYPLCLQLAGGSESVCPVPCTPETADQCPVGIHCRLVAHPNRPIGVGVALCAAPTGPGMQGDPCASVVDCAAGLACGADSTCQTYCVFAPPGTGPECPAGSTCRSLEIPVRVGELLYGTCR